MTAGVVTAMVGFGMYSYTKLFPARPGEDSRRGDPPLSAAYQPVRISDSGLLSTLLLPNAPALTARSYER